MNKNPKLSIITICLNAGSTIQQCIDSCISQKFTDFEFLIIDGGSTDQTLSIINKYKAFVDVLVSEKDAGISNAYNKGIKMTKGEYILFLNADDWLEEDALENIVPYLETSFSVFCGGVNFWDQFGIRNTAFSAPKLLRRESLVHHAGSIFSKSLFEEIGDFNEGYLLAMDYEIFLRAFHRGVHFKNLNFIVANRRLGGVSNVQNYNALKETLKARREYEVGLTLYLPFLYACMKNYLGIFLNRIGGNKLYRLYWKINNKVLLSHNSINKKKES